MKRDELPALQWYSGDWRKDPGVRVLTFEQRGIWFEMLMVMHESERRGALVLNGKPMSEDQIAQVIGCEPKRFRTALEVILDTGVASRDDSGAVINRRMVRDEQIRQVRKAAGRLGGNPALVGTLVKQNGNLLKQSDNQSPTPSSSSSSSSSNPHPARANGLASKAMRDAGISKANPSHPELIALVDAGATPEQFAEAAREAIRKAANEPFGYALAVLKSQMQRAAATSSTMPGRNRMDDFRGAI